MHHQLSLLRRAPRRGVRGYITNTAAREGGCENWKIEGVYIHAGSHEYHFAPADCSAPTACPCSVGGRRRHE